MNHKRFEAIYQLHYEDLLSFAKNHVSDSYQAEDLVQETFLFFLEHGMNNASCRNNSLYSTLISLAKSTLNQPACFLSFDDDAFTNSENLYYTSSLFQAFTKQQSIQNNFDTLQMLVPQLPDEEQQIFTLFYFEGKNAKEISEIIPLSHDTIRKKLERSKKKLKEIYLHTA